MSSLIRYKVELRKPKAAIKEMRNWQESQTFDTEQEAIDRIAWWREYDTYYSLEGWEYQITQVNPRKSK